METLKAYFSSIDPRLLNHVSGKPSEFIHTFQEQNFLSEEAFAQALCGDNYDKNIYTNWKSRTLKILQAFAIISDGKGASLVKKKYDNCQKKFLLGQKFLSQGQRSEGLRLVKQAYQIASEYDFSHLASELGTILHHDHVYYHRNKRMAEFYSDKAWKHLIDYTAEKNATKYFWKIVQEQMHASISIDLLEKACAEVEKIKGESTQYKVYRGMIHILYHLYSGQYIQLIANCNTTLTSFETQPGAYPGQHFFFFQIRGTAQTAIGHYEEATKSFEQAKQFTTNKPYNIYTLEFYKTLNALHAGNYQKAYTLYQKNKRCKIEDIRQHFAIVEAYLCFLSHANFLQINKIFRMGKYLNDTFKAQEDKQGDNINIVIARLLIHLVRNRGKFIDYVEVVQSYSYRHLKEEDTKRAKWFLKILCLLAHPRVNFHPEALRRRAKKQIELLESHPMRMGGNFMVEIIPFDQLLQMILTRVISRAA